MRVSWSTANLQGLAARRMKQVAYACRYGKAGLTACLSVDAETLGAFVEAVSEIVEEERDKNQ